MIQEIIVSDTVKVTFNIDTESTNKTRRIVNNVDIGKKLVKNNADAWIKGT